MLLKLLFPIFVVVIQQAYLCSTAARKGETSEEKGLLRLRKYAFFGTKKIFNPTGDTMFKRIFTDPSILLEFVNSVLRRADDNLFTSIEYIDKVYIPDYRHGRPVELDIVCKTNTGEEIIVEMQVRKETYFLNRAFFYVCRAYTEQYDTTQYYKALEEETAKKEGRQPTTLAPKSSAYTKKLSEMDKPYEALRPVHLIVFADHSLFSTTSEEKCEKFISTHLLLDNVTHENHMNQCSVTYIELPKMKNCNPKNFQTSPEKMSYFLFFDTTSDSYKSNLLALVNEDEHVRKMFQIADESNWTPEEKSRMVWLQMHEDRLRDQFMTSNLEAEEIGVQKGVQIGVQQNKIETARILLKNPKFTDDDIKQATGLSADEIAKLRSTP